VGTCTKYGGKHIVDISFLRSSSYNAYDFCPMSYWCDYNLGIKGESGFAADKGTAVHKILEIMALAKLAKQNRKRKLDADIVGKISTTNYDLDELIEKVYHYYSTNIKHHDWSASDYRDIKKWTYMALEANNGQFDPRNRNIVDAEPFFFFFFPEPWTISNYNSTVVNHFSIKGTIDLVTQVSKDDAAQKIYEIIDWKSGGQRKNWATDEIYTLDTFKYAIQPRMYHYAVHKMYKDVDQVLVTMFYIRAGGPFTICFEHKDLAETEEMLRVRHKKIRGDNYPKCRKSWKCGRFCHYGKTTFEGTHIKPVKKYRKCLTQCGQLEEEFRRHTIDDILNVYKVPGFELDHYKDPGAIE